MSEWSSKLADTCDDLRAERDDLAAAYQACCNEGALLAEKCDRLTQRVKVLSDMRPWRNELTQRVKVLEEALREVCAGNDLAAERGESVKNWPGSYVERKARAALGEEGHDG